LSRLFFRIPFLSNYLTENIKENIMAEAKAISSKKRLELLIKFSDYFEAEMIYVQNISKHRSFKWSLSKLDLIKDIV